MRFVNWDPFRELEDLQRVTDRLLGMGTRPHYTKKLEYPPLDVLEDEEGFVVIASLPGMSRDNLHISVLGQVMTIEGERASEAEEGHEYLRRERGYGKFQRRIQFQSDVQADQIKAQYQDGLLSVSVPKAESAKPKQITVASEE